MNGFLDELTDLVEKDLRRDLQSQHARLSEGQIEALIDLRLRVLAKEFFERVRETLT
jgi:hypothetical protein